MPQVIVSLDGVVIKEFQLTKPRVTLGRRAYNDIVLDNLTVSGEHAAIQLSGKGIYLEDLNSTNGTFVNGKAITRHLLQASDVIAINTYTIQCVDTYEMDVASSSFASSSFAINAANSPSGLALAPARTRVVIQALMKVMSGTASGREMSLVKAVTTIGKLGVSVATITRQKYGFCIAHAEGDSKPMLNGAVLGDKSVGLKNGDLLELAGIQMQFVQY